MMSITATAAAPFTATITTVMFGVTVSPASGTYGRCRGGNSTANALGFPNGVCFIDAITVTNTSTASTAHIDVQGSDAIPGDGGTPHWTLTTAGNPGQDQFDEVAEAPGGGQALTTTPACNVAFNPTVTADQCSATPGLASIQTLAITGPTASTDPSTTLTTTVTWIAGS